MSEPLKNEKVASGGSLTELKPEIEQEARDFLSETLGRQITGDFGAILKDGTLLCEFINKLSPKANVKINKQKAPFLQMENIGSYLTACKNLGVTSEYLFMTVDLYEQKNLAIVALNIIALKRQLGFGFQRTKSIQGGVFDYTVDQKTAPEKAPSIKDGGVKPQPSPPQQAPKQQQSPSVKVNFCSSCGTKATEGSRFCASCGTAL